MDKIIKSKNKEREKIYMNFEGTYKKIIIYGAGIVARAAINVLKELGKEVECCVVSKPSHNTKEVEGIPVYRYEDVVEKYRKEHFIVAVREKYVSDIIKMLKKFHVSEYEIYGFKECIEILEKNWAKEYSLHSKIFAENVNRNMLSDEDYIMFLSKQLKNKEITFEVNLVDHCNLNCQCCNHFSPLADKNFLNLEKFEKDIERISVLSQDRVVNLSLLGGEPLLHSKIKEIMKISRRHLWNATITIFTNGLLLPKMDNDFWKECRDNNIGLLITRYPIEFDYYVWEKKAIEEKVRITITYDSIENKTTYKLPIKEEGNLNPYQNYAKCYHANHCTVLRDGRLYTCPIAANVHHFNKYFLKNIPEGEKNSIDIYSVNSYEEIEDFLKYPIPMCKHCDIYNYEYEIPWKTTNRDILEWT